MCEKHHNKIVIKYTSNWIDCVPLTYIKLKSKQVSNAYSCERAEFPVIVIIIIIIIIIIVQ